MMSEGNTLVHFKLMLVILIVIISNISFCIVGTFVSAYSSHSYGVSSPPQNISASSAYDMPIGKDIFLIELFQVSLYMYFK